METLVAIINQTQRLNKKNILYYFNAIGFGFFRVGFFHLGYVPGSGQSEPGSATPLLRVAPLSRSTTRLYNCTVCCSSRPKSQRTQGRPGNNSYRYFNIKILSSQYIISDFGRLDFIHNAQQYESWYLHGNSGHIAHAWRNIVFFGEENNRFAPALDLIKSLQQIK